MATLQTYRYTLLCVLVFVVCAAASHPVSPSGVIDDWSYIWTAKRLAETGHLEYNGWANAILGWQLYLAALFIKIFGFTWTIARVTVMLLAISGLGLSHRILVRLGVSARDAAIVTMGFTCNTVFLAHAVTYMSDVPGWLTVLICLYLCIRALQAQTDQATAIWLATAGISNMMLGTVRQIAWLGALVMVPAVTWCLRRRPLPFRAGVGASVVSVAGVALWMRWWNHVPYAVHEQLFFLHRNQITMSPWFTLTIFVFATPVLIGFLLKTRRWWPPLLGAALGVLMGVTLPETGSYWGVGPLGPDLMNNLSKTYASIAAAVVLASAATFLHAAWESWSSLRKEKEANDAGSSPLNLTNAELFWLLVPYTIALCLLLYTRGALWPRYWLPFLPVAGIWVMWVFYRWRPGVGLPGICFVAIAFGSVVSIVYVDTLFAYSRALVSAENEYLAAGYPRSQLEAGFASDGLYEIALHGYINDYRITTPRVVYFEPPKTLPDACLDSTWYLMPSLDRRYALQFQYGGCYQPMGLPPVVYKSMYPPFRREIVITKLTPSAATSSTPVPAP